MKEVEIEASWKKELESEFQKKYFRELVDFVRAEYANKKIYPNQKNIFQAFWLCPFSKVRVVVLGQDPYHGENQANGLAFAVSSGVKIPPSLQNIFKEIKGDLGVAPEMDGDLSRWAKQGVLLLNATLTVASSAPTSHKGKGWEQFTDMVIKKISDDKENVVFILWGNYARSKKSLIDSSRHLVLESAHPSPFSAYKGFFGTKPFSQANKYLKEQKKKEIDWR